MQNSYAIIMAGGSGTRFWPISRTPHPKQFLDILGTGRTLLQGTYDRFARLFKPENIYVVSNVIYFDLIREQLPDLPAANIIAEPMARNTAPCIAYASWKIAKNDPKANCVVAPSDHLIQDETRFLEDIRTALEFTEKNHALCTLGIRPNRPDTGYGYIQYLEEGNDTLKKVKTFTEKPSLEIAQTFLASGDFLWNAGIFIWKNSEIKKAFETFLPDINDIFRKAAKGFDTEEEAKLIQDAYSRCPNISIDYGIMEKADNVYVLPVNFGWSDLGTWLSLFELHEKDANNNAINGKNVVLYDSKNCIVHAPDDKLVVLKNVENLIVVESDNIIMVCDKNAEQEVRQIVTDMKIRYGERFI